MTWQFPLFQQSALADSLPLASVLIILPQQQRCGRCSEKDALLVLLIPICMTEGSKLVEHRAFLSTYCVQQPLLSMDDADSHAKLKDRFGRLQVSLILIPVLPDLP